MVIFGDLSHHNFKKSVKLTLPYLISFKFVEYFFVGYIILFLYLLIIILLYQVTYLPHNFLKTCSELLAENLNI